MFFARRPTIGAAAGSVTGMLTKAFENAPAPIDMVVKSNPETVAVPEPGAATGARPAIDVSKVPVKASVAA